MAATSLPSWTYCDPALMALEREKIFLPAWHLVCHVNDIPNAGDYSTFAMLGEIAFVVRGKDGRVGAFHNVCRHRGARLLDGETGNCGRAIVCPYHAWTYELDGRLKGAPHADQYENFERSAHGLVPVECGEAGGFIFIRFRLGPETLADYLAPIAEELSIYRSAEMKPLRNTGLRMRRANWKTACDNYVDGLHIQIAHDGLDALLGDSYRLTIDRGAYKIFSSLKTSRNRSRSNAAYCAILPRIRHLPEERQSMWTYYKLWPALMFDVYPDQLDFMQFIPLSPTTCLLRERAYGLDDERREMKCARYLNWRINRTVNREDQDLIERVQEGMGSSSFISGPLGRNEICLRDFADRFRETIPVARAERPPAK